MNVLGVTLARGGSVGVPRKNIREVAGKPLLAWTIEQALEASLLDRYVVSTDSPEIANVARNYGAEVIYRPAELATDTAPSIGALIHALDTVEGDWAMLVDIRATNPLKTSHDIDNCVRLLHRTGADVVCGVSLLDDHHPMRIKTMVAGNRLVDVWPEPISGLRQDLHPKAYIRNGSIYACRANALREGIHFSGGDIRGYEMPAERSVNVDTELDLLVCEQLLTSRS